MHTLHRYFNLVSDICTSVNAHYMNVSVFNVIDRIAIRAVDEGGACREVLLNVEGMCSVSVDGTSVESSYMRDGISIRRYILTCTYVCNEYYYIN